MPSLQLRDSASPPSAPTTCSRTPATPSSTVSAASASSTALLTVSKYARSGHHRALLLYILDMTNNAANVQMSMNCSVCLCLGLFSHFQEVRGIKILSPPFRLSFTRSFFHPRLLYFPWIMRTSCEVVTWASFLLTMSLGATHLVRLVHSDSNNSLHNNPTSTHKNSFWFCHHQPSAPSWESHQSQPTCRALAVSWRNT